MNAKRSVGWLVLGFASLASVAAITASASEPVVGVKDAEALFTSKDPKLNRNKQAAYHIQKELLECNFWQDADKYLTRNLKAVRPFKFLNCSAISAHARSRSVSWSILAPD